MGLLDRASTSFSAWVLDKIRKTKTTLISYEQLVDIVRQEFINGADDEFLEKTCKAAKGRLFSNKPLQSKSERYALHVECYGTSYTVLGVRKRVYVSDHMENKIYRLNSDKHWKKFYKAVINDVKREKINRSR